MNDLEYPLISIILLTYNHENFIEAALDGVFSQSYPNLEIIISDDMSKDKTVEVINEYLLKYSGPFLFKFNQNKNNLGIGAHINKAFNLSNGKLIVLAAGDDISHTNRIFELYNEWKRNQFCSCLIYSNCAFIDRNSNFVQNLSEIVFKGKINLEMLAKGNIRILGATTAITRDVVVSFPNLNQSVIHEDRVLPFRVLLAGGKILFVDKLLVSYRIDGGISRFLIKDKFDILQLRLLKNTLPDALQRLDDLMYKAPNEKKFKKMCQKTILEHHAKIHMIESSILNYEYYFIYYLLKGVRFMKIFKLYLKLRFYYFYQKYYYFRYFQAY